MVWIDWGMYMSIIGLGARQGGGAGPTWLTRSGAGHWPPRRFSPRMYVRETWFGWNMGLWEHLLGAVMAWSEGGPEPWWGGPYHAIQNWGWEVLWGSEGFPEKSVPEPPLCILLLKINIPSSYFIICMLNCLIKVSKINFDSWTTAVKFFT